MANTGKMSEFELPIEIRSYEIDAWNDLSDYLVLHLLEHLAREASAVGGFDSDWYERQGTAWIIRRMALARAGAFRYGDALIGRTWVSDIRRVRSNRDYQIRRSGDGEVLVTARADWVYVDRAGQRPTPVDPGIVAAVELHPPASGMDLLPLATEVNTARTFTSSRIAGRYEADSMAHINNAVYSTWLEEALAAALRDAGVPLAPPARPGPRLLTTRLLLDYRQSALPGDTISINTRLLGATADPAVLSWQQEITSPQSGAAILSCTSQRRLVDLDPGAVLAAMG